MSGGPYLATNSQDPHELPRGAHHTYLFTSAPRAGLSQMDTSAPSTWYCKEGGPCTQTLVLRRTGSFISLAWLCLLSKALAASLASRVRECAVCRPHFRGRQSVDDRPRKTHVSQS